jgi:S-formylglutathione hydrolase FrmB
MYMLHGMNGTEVSWMNNAKAQETVLKQMESGELPECIVVMPNDGEYGQGTFYMDWYDGTGNFEQYIVHDLIPFIDNEYRTLATRESRVVCGYSMGGFGAFSLSLRHPSLFGAATSLSGALASIAALPYREFIRSPIYPRMVGPVNGPYARAHDLAVLAAQRQEEGIMPALYFDCGTEDFLHPLNAGFHKFLNSISYTHVYREFQGDHNWSYWIEHLPDTLAFFSQFWAQSGVYMEQ